jgi:hypothetical protein
VSSYGHTGSYEYYNPQFPIKVVASPFLNITERVQVRFPRSKKRRIRKKWTRRQRNWRTVEAHRAFMVRDTLVCHPSIVAKLQERVKRRVEASFFGAPTPPPQSAEKGGRGCICRSCERSTLGAGKQPVKCSAGHVPNRTKCDDYSIYP